MRKRLARAGLGCWALLALGCGGASSQAPAAEKPEQARAYPGRCELVGLEMVEVPTERPAADSGSVQLVATYRPGESGDHPPLSFSFRVQRERVDDLRAHLRQHPTVLCAPKPEGSAAPSYGVEVPPFEGQSAEPVEH